MTTTTLPPSIHALFDDPVYVKYVRQVPVLPVNIQHGHPWQVWVRSGPRWGGKRFATYREAWGMFTRAFRNADYDDVALVSRRRFYEPPLHFVWDPSFDWCPRCRRPSSFIEVVNHHATKSFPATTMDEPAKCYFCGIRKAIVGDYNAHYE